MRQPTDKEMNCILYARKMHKSTWIFWIKTIIQSIFFNIYFDKRKCVVGNVKSIKDLWERFGVEYSTVYDVNGNFVGSYKKSAHYYYADNNYFSELDKVSCLNHWIKTLYGKEIDLLARLENIEKSIQEGMRRAHEKGKRVSFLDPMEILLIDLEKELGEY